MSIGMIRTPFAPFLLPAIVLFTRPMIAQESPQIGVFQGQTDIGTVEHPGSASFNSDAKSYTVAGSGGNIWGGSDQFHFVWQKVTAENLTLTANIALLGEGGDPHRKAVLMVRQSLDADSPYADAALHGNGLASLQFRLAKDAPTHEIQANVSAPKRLRLEKIGERFFLWIAPDGYTLQFAGGSIQIPLQPPFYVGIGVCAHNAAAVQQAEFSDVELSTTLPGSIGRVDYSTIQTVNTASTDSRAIYVTHDAVELPSWQSQSILFQAGGKRFQVDVTGGKAQPTDVELPENFGQERSPDGRYVYVLSNRTGAMQIWRQNPDGSDPEQLTRDAMNDAEPRLSPDGKQIAYISYPANLMILPDRADIFVRVLSLTDNTVRTLAKIAGGRNSLGAAPWSPDSKQLTFASYQSFP